jgi:hypothetical protein
MEQCYSVQHKSYVGKRNQERLYCSFCGKSYTRAFRCWTHIEEKHPGYGYPVREYVYILNEFMKVTGNRPILAPSLSPTQPNPYAIMPRKRPTFLPSKGKQVTRVKEEEEIQEIPSKTPLEAFNACRDEYLNEFGRILARSKHAPLANLPAGSTIHFHNTYHNNYYYSYSPLPSSSTSTSSFFSLASPSPNVAKTTSSSAESFSSRSPSSSSSSAAAPPRDVAMPVPLSLKQHPQEQAPQEQQQQQDQLPLIGPKTLENQQRWQVEQEFSRRYAEAGRNLSTKHIPPSCQPLQPSSSPFSLPSSSPSPSGPQPGTSTTIPTTLPTSCAVYGNESNNNDIHDDGAKEEKEDADDIETARIIGIQAFVCSKCHSIVPRVFRSLPRHEHIIVEDVHFNCCKRNEISNSLMNIGKENYVAASITAPARNDNKISREKAIRGFLKDKVIRCMRKDGQTDTMIIATEIVAATPYLGDSMVRQRDRMAGNNNRKETNGRATTATAVSNAPLKFSVSSYDESRLRRKYLTLNYSDSQCVLLDPKNTGDWALRVIRDGSTRINDAELEEFLLKTKTKTFAFFKKKEDKEKVRIFLIAISETDYCEDGRSIGNCENNVGEAIKIVQLVDSKENHGHSNSSNHHHSNNYCNSKKKAPNRISV